MKNVFLLLALLITSFGFSQASIALVKTGVFNDESGDGCADLNETISFSFVVTNTGAESLLDVEILDDMVTVIGGPITLNPGEANATAFTATYSITQDDLNESMVVNQAEAMGTDSSGTMVSDLSDDNSSMEDDPTVITLCVLGISDESLPELFALYPNPAKDKIRIQLNEPATHAKFLLYNVSGQEIVNRNITMEKTWVDISQLSVGAYFISVFQNGQISRLTLIKN